MKNPFKMKPPVEKPNRNVFDLSHAVNFSAKFGKLYPLLCKEVVPGDSFRIESAFGLRFMPLAFPVQSRIRADVHYFYVRNRNLWKDWPDFIGATKEVTPPYIVSLTSNEAQRKLGTGSLGDYLGVPSTVSRPIKTYFSSIPLFDKRTSWIDYPYTGSPIVRLPDTASMVANASIWDNLGIKQLYDGSYPVVANLPSNRQRLFIAVKDVMGFILGGQNFSTKKFHFEGLGRTLTLSRIMLFVTNVHADMHDVLLNNYISYMCYCSDTSQITLSDYNGQKVTPSFSDINMKSFFTPVAGTPTGQTVTLADAITTILTNNNSFNENTMCIGFEFDSSNFVVSKSSFINGSIIGSDTVSYDGEHIKDILVSESVNLSMEKSVGFITDANSPEYEYGFHRVVIGDFDTQTYMEVNEIPESPYVGTNPAIKLSALPFRAYESVYNGFYRNQQVDPFKIDGVPEYNKFVSRCDGGPDDYPYDLFDRYWEQDFLTTSLPSPQQGIAPLVGSRQTQGTYQLITTIDGQQKIINVTSGESGDLTAVSTYGQDVDESTLQTLQSAIDFGISINDFRNVNCLQRWLEKNIRRGYRYRDQIMTHFGVEVRYDELDMPEYIGGVSQDVNVSVVTQTVENEYPLGSYAGQATAFGKGKEVSHYFDEHGFVIAIMSISPIPSFSQLLPKMFLKHSHLDYYFPEFGHIGLQPIPVKEVTPNEAFVDSVPLDKTFGYQRPWYDYLASVDTTHSLLRTQLRDFVVNRYFSSTPQLSPDFLKIKTHEVNDIFTVQDYDDKCVGQIYFNVIAKRPISMFAEPRID